MSMTEPMHDAALPGLMSVDPVEVVEDEPVRFTGPSPILVRRDTKQAWSQAKTLDVLKDMHPEQLQAWVDGMNETAGFAKYRVPADA
ncbi:hypothetical protein QDW18_gp38 [Microbacterium phage Katzastrophic]|uniref:hypothetical protein n=1 Tax=Microbacterium phage Katzastrophic TaxID=2912654 RepID=UPI0024331246|nr:hypothetical protein QDW18_gp38 [Microbacterium phage Katzastrophic]UKH48475.1 hypothetical protein SEA_KATZASTROPHIC_38 [Microbacterium phage Katzastrophic]